MRTAATLALMGLLAVFFVSSAESAKRKPNSPPASQPADKTPPATTYTIRQIEGWTVHVDDQLLTTKKETGDKALRLLEMKLYDVTRVIPPTALEKIRTVHIWLEYDNPKVECACYHPSETWLQKQGFLAEKVRSVEIGNSERFLTWTVEQPMMVLHELAHAYHHQVLEYDNAEIKAAYKQMMASKTYEKVLRVSGKTVSHYARKSDQEYFAESTEAYFGTNDFYPFVHGELKQHDPEMFNLVKKLWSN